MQITGETDWKEQGAACAQALDQQEEIGAVRTLTSKVSLERRNADIYPERDMYRDMDVALPFHWESMTGKGHKLSRSSGSQEFEFSMSGVSVDPSDPVVSEGISPADDLFYKGQLLPLHLPKRLQMVQKLSSPKHAEKDTSASVSVSCVFQPSSLKYSPLGSDEGYLGSALVNSRSSSFHSQGSNNFWESDSPGEPDSADSSSSRDSSGSSQDACVSEKQTLPSKFKEHISCHKERSHCHHDDFSSTRTLPLEKSLFSSWLRTPFKWKVFFGLKKPSRSQDDLKVDGPRRLRPASMSSSRPGSYFSAEQNMGSKKSLSDLERQGGLFSFPGADTGLSRDKEQDSSASKARETLHKYLHILKPVSGKVSLKTDDQADVTSTRIVDIKDETSFSGNLPTSSRKYSLTARLPSPKPAVFNNLSSPKSSFSEGRCRSPATHSFSGNLRVPSFSRSSKASANASNAVGKVASPHNSGVLNNSPSTMAELHSAIQGAIAHCKQSQSVDK